MSEDMNDHIKNYYAPFATVKDGHIIVASGDVCLCGSYAGGVMTCGELIAATNPSPVESELTTLRQRVQQLEKEKRDVELDGHKIVFKWKDAKCPNPFTGKIFFREED